MPYSQTLDMVGKALQGLIMNVRNYSRIKFKTLGPGDCTINVFTVVINFLSCNLRACHRHLLSP
jgi:hypothetical protein